MLALTSRRVIPAPPEPGRTVNLDALGRLGALLCQIAALEAVSALPAGETAEIIRDGARVRVMGEEASALAEDLMDTKDELTALLGEAGAPMLGECLDALRRVYQDR